MKLRERKYNESEWDHILDNTWHHNAYHNLMCSILYKRYPIERHESHADRWWEEKTFTSDEMREVIHRIEDYWKDKVRIALRDGIDINGERLE